jgi:phage/plasmid-like protein (TIGR03299 family)
MAHLIDTSRRAAGGFYSLRKPAWHNLGTVVDVPADDPRILELAGLDWSTDLRPMFTSDRDGNPIAIGGEHRAVVRSDTGAPLGVVGPRYTAVNNSDLMDAIRRIDGAASLHVETAGCLDGGRSVFVLVQHERLSFAIGRDASKGFLLVTNRHDGRETLRILPTTVRVVCANTLGLALGIGRGQGHSLRHTASVGDSLADVVAQYRRAVEAHDKQREALEALARVRSTPDSLMDIMRASWEITPETLKDEADRARSIREAREARIAAIRQGPTCDVQGTAGTLFADFNAITEYVDHNGRGPAHAVAGAGVDIKARALDAALALI